MGKIGKCCCEPGCCLTSSKLPTEIILHCDGIDYPLTMGAWVEQSDCCWVAESDPVAVPDLTQFNFMELLKSYFSAETLTGGYMISDMVSWPTITYCGEIVPSNDRVLWYTRTYHSEYLHEYFLKYKVKHMNLKLSISKGMRDCDADGERCRWQITTEFIGRETTGADRNDVRILGRFFGQSSRVTHYTNPDASCISDPDDGILVKDWTSDNYDDTSDPLTDDPVAPVRFSRAVQFLDPADLDEVVFDPGATVECYPNCVGIADDEEAYSTGQNPDVGYVTARGALIFGSKPANVLTDPGPGPWPQETRRKKSNGNGTYSICDIFGGETYVGVVDETMPCSGVRFNSFLAGNNARISYRENTVGGPNVYSIVRPSYSLKFTWP